MGARLRASEFQPRIGTIVMLRTGANDISIYTRREVSNQCTVKKGSKPTVDGSRNRYGSRGTCVNMAKCEREGLQTIGAVPSNN